MKKFLAIFLAVAMLALACVATVSAEEKVNVLFVDPKPYVDAETGEIDYASWKNEIWFTSGVANQKGTNVNYSIDYSKNYGYSLGQQWLQDGELSADPDLNPNFFEYRINNVYAGLDADGNKNKGDYVAWWGFAFVKPVTCDSFEIYFRDDGGIAGLAILGGTKNADGSIAWTELAREATLNAAGKTTQYDALTKCWAGNFTAPATMDYVRVAYLGGSQTYTFLSEFKMFAVGGAVPAETTAAPVETTAAPVETTAAPVETTAAPVETTAAPVETTAAPAAEHVAYLSPLPANLTSKTNIWETATKSDKYYTGAKWNTLNDKLQSITIPVKEGDQLWATSFQAAGTNGYTTNGIRITFFDAAGVPSSVAPATVYNEFKDAGYVTVPAGATAVNIPMWDATVACEVYIVNAAAATETTAAPVDTTAAPVNTTAPIQTPDTADVSMIVVMVAVLALTAVVVLRRKAVH